MTRRRRLGVGVSRIGGWEREWYAVTLQPIRVRYVADTPQPWRCDQCGWHDLPTCPHEIAAATAAAQHEWK